MKNILNYASFRLLAEPNLSLKASGTTVEAKILETRSCSVLSLETLDVGLSIARAGWRALFTYKGLGVPPREPMGRSDSRYTILYEPGSHILHAEEDPQKGPAEYRTHGTTDT